MALGHDYAIFQPFYSSARSSTRPDHAIEHDRAILFSFQNLKSFI